MADEPATCDEQLPLEVPGILLRLAELEEIAMQAARDRSRGLDCQLMAVQVAHKLYIDRLLAIEMRDLQAGQRHLEASIARNRANRDGLGSDW